MLVVVPLVDVVVNGARVVVPDVVVVVLVTVEVPLVLFCAIKDASIRPSIAHQRIAQTNLICVWEWLP